MKKKHFFARRDFLKAIGYGAVTGSVFLNLNEAKAADAKKSEKAKSGTIRFGLCADVHKDIMHDTDARLKTFIDRMNTEKVDFIMQLGDFVRPYEHNQGFLDIFNQFKGPRYHVLGNHDMDGGFTREQTLKFWGVQDKYYSFDQNGYHFIVLDGNDKRTDHPGGYPKYIGPEQIAWLKEDLKNTQLPTLIFSHQGLGPDSGSVDNAQEIQSILEQANSGKTGRVIACVNGHTHVDKVTKHNGIYYIQINSMSYYWMGGDFRHARYSPEIEKKFPWVSYTAPYKDALYAIVTLKPDGITIEGIQSQWVPPSPMEMNIPEDAKYDRFRTATPSITNRTVKL